MKAQEKKIPQRQAPLNEIIRNKVQLFSDYLTRQNKTVIYIYGLLLLFTVSLINASVHQKLSMSVFYLIPICMISWYTTRYGGILFAVLSSISLSLSHYDQMLNYRQWVAQIWNSFGSLLFYCVMVLLLRLIKTRFEFEKRQAAIDSLTNVANRRSFLKSLLQETIRAKRYSHPFSVVFMDVDNFKEVNDSKGHQEGDYLLQIIAEKLTQNLRSSDIISRFGGDEFAILMPETSETQIKDPIGRIHLTLLDTMKEYNWPVTFSIGVVTYKTFPETIDEIISLVDQAMYKVKKRDKNGIEYCVF